MLTQAEYNFDQLKTYNFDRVFDNTSTNVEVYDFVAADITQKAVQGFNGTVFAYGQTGSGKTWSMMGIPEDPGIIRRSLDECPGDRLSRMS